MYERIGTYPGDLTILVEAMHRLHPKPTLPLGYLTTDSEATMEIYRPLLQDFFPGEWVKCFLSIVWPNGGTIMAHADADVANYERQHLVMKTNSDSWCMHDGGVERLEIGGVYRMDATKVHAAMNWGTDVRIHFVVDR